MRTHVSGGRVWGWFCDGMPSLYLTDLNFIAQLNTAYRFLSFSMSPLALLVGTCVSSTLLVMWSQGSTGMDFNIYLVIWAASLVRIVLENPVTYLHWIKLKCLQFVGQFMECSTQKMQYSNLICAEHNLLENSTIWPCHVPLDRWDSLWPQKLYAEIWLFSEKSSSMWSQTVGSRYTQGTLQSLWCPCRDYWMCT